ncbi:diguanylate cyclase [Undibacterium jejuense]|uniref:diguanylate cyclase n=1 Tax=Undibacterium jejuense TaxID=1344949 RepID=A0A923KRA7_9BURK|nr:sensor domain-containing diguanylate cyclase [Undibacterium jejuense]MBC3863801.1 diguanylate cyclase [Undibacterium jejuense]
MKQWQLSQRILFLALAPVWVITILLTLMVVIVGMTEIDGALKERGALIARHLSSACEYGAFSGNREVLTALTQATMKEEDAQAVIVTDALNHVLAASGKPENIDATYPGAALQGKILKGKHSSFIFGMPIYQGTLAADNFDLIDRPQNEPTNKTKLLGFVYLELSTASSKQEKTLFVFICLLIGIAGTAGASILALRMSRDLTRPLSRLIDGVHSMAKGEFSTRIKADSGGELQDLEEGFNLMAAEVQNSHEKMLEVNANLEHLVAERTRELELKNLDLEYLSNTDRLTGLYNRFKLETILEEEHQRCQRYGSSFSIAIIDVDKFKSVNDTYGHSVGDQVLVSIGIILQENIRSIDAAGRWGGEEFLVIFRETSIQASIVIAEKLRETIANHNFHMISTLTASFGVTEYRHPDSILEMMIRADAALYEAKHKGRNRVEYKEH